MQRSNLASGLCLYTVKKLGILIAMLISMWVAGAGEALCAPYDASGTWSSDWGPVSLLLSGPQADQTYNITGHWQQSAKRGEILRGNYDPGSGKLWFGYYQPWNNDRGTAIFRMNDSGTKLNGNWKQASGSGTWTLARSSSPLLAGGPAPTPAPTPTPTPTPATTAPVARTSTSVSGVWNSEWGPVTLRQGTPQMDGGFLLSGSWVQGPGQVGLIQQGRVNGKVVAFKYSMPWKGTTGSARLTLQPGGKMLSGVWTQKGASGTWTLTR